ncbi:protein kinase [Aureococcus anophagefferens]|nr:protein kinase [Aureococcus anophagefferens]
MASTWALQKALPPEDPNVVERALGDGRVQIGAYEVLEVIGEGEFASVWEARSAARPGERLAMKAIKKARAKRNIARVDREVAALQRLRHAGVCRLYGVVHSPTYVYLVMEAGDRDLFAFLDGYPRGCDDGTVCAVMRILALALRHCHNAGVAHRDVKPENVLVVGDPATWGDAEES